VNDTVKKRKDPSMRVVGENIAATWGVPGAHHRKADGKYAKDPNKRLKKAWGF